MVWRQAWMSATPSARSAEAKKPAIMINYSLVTSAGSQPKTACQPSETAFPTDLNPSPTALAPSLTACPTPL